MKISKDKKYKTKRGHDVEILGIDGVDHAYGLIHFKNHPTLSAIWDKNGHLTAYRGDEDSFDLVEVNEDQYYTPSIDEFHVGFEYEVLKGFMDGTVKSIEKYVEEVMAGNWDKYKVDDVNDLAYIDRALHGRNAERGLCGIRVKKLDREDIESLGWKFAEHDDFFKSDVYVLDNYHWTQYQYRLEAEIDGEISIESIKKSSTDEPFTIFFGTIKNKSELKKVMEMIDIPPRV